MIDEIVKEDIKKTTKNVESSKEAAEAVNNTEKVIKSNKCNILLLVHQQDQIFEKLKMNYNFIDMVKKNWD